MTRRKPNDRPDDRKRRLNKALRTMSRMIHKIEVDLSVVSDDLDDLRRGDLDGPGRYIPTGPEWPPRSPSDRPDDAEKALKAQADQGVRDVEIVRRRKGAKLKIPGHPTVRVTHGEADILDVLVDRDGDQASRPGGWITADQLARCLSKRGQAPVTPRAIVQRICRLRQRMRTGGLNKYLLQSDRTRGYRFALRGDDRGVAARLTSIGRGPESRPAEQARIT